VVRFRADPLCDLMEVKTPFLATDIIIQKDERILLILREIEPHKNKLTFPGGFVEYGETIEQAAVREAKEETSLKIRLKEILGVYSDPRREPRFHAVTVVFIAEIIGGKLKGSFEGKPRWYSLKEINFSDLGFDHSKILKDYIKWKKSGRTFWSSK
jgi:ADP-ribose pyrophosphatase YjhB (NUDIX family)